MMPPRSRGLAAAGLLVFGGCGGGTEARSGSPIDLRLETGAEPTAYVARYDQDIRWGVAILERRYGARYTLAPGRGEGRSVTAGRLDSLGIAVSTPHGRQVLDTRHLVGSEFALSVPERGGMPEFSDDVPVLQMPGVVEGEVALARLMTYGFPELPDRPVGIGDTWSVRSSRPQVEAHLHMTADLTTEYRLAGWDTIDGTDVVRIVGRVAGRMSTEGQVRNGASHDYAGTLEGEIAWHVDPVTRTVVRVAGEESSDGVMSVGAATSTIRQQTRVEIERASGP